MKNKKNSQARKVNAQMTKVRKKPEIKVTSIGKKPSYVMNKSPRISQKKVPSKSLTKTTKRTSKFKIMAAIVGVLVISSIGLGLGFGLSSSSSSPVVWSKQLIEWKEVFDSLDSNESISSVVVSTPFTKVDNEPLTADLMKEFKLNEKLPEVTENISISYSHPSLNSNGNLPLTLRVEDENKTSIQKVLTLTVQGLDLVNAKDYFNNLQPKPVVKYSVIPPLTTETSFTPTLGQEYFFNYTSQVGTTVTYTHEGLTEDGTLVLKFKIMENDLETIERVEKRIEVTGIDLGKVKTYFEERLVTKKLERLSRILPLEEKPFDASIASLYFEEYEQPEGVEITYYHNGLAEDGTLVIYFIIKQQNLSIRVSKNVEVTGINQWDAQTYLLTLNKKQFSDRSQVPILEKGTLDANTASKFFVFSSEEPYKAPSDVTITYEVTDISEKNDFLVKFTITNDELAISVYLDLTYEIGA